MSPTSTTFQPFTAHSTSPSHEPSSASTSITPVPAHVRSISNPRPLPKPPAQAQQARHTHSQSHGSTQVPSSSYAHRVQHEGASNAPINWARPLPSARNRLNSSGSLASSSGSAAPTSPVETSAQTDRSPLNSRFDPGPSGGVPCANLQCHIANSQSFSVSRRSGIADCSALRFHPSHRHRMSPAQFQHQQDSEITHPPPSPLLRQSLPLVLDMPLKRNISLARLGRRARGTRLVRDYRTISWHGLVNSLASP